MSDDHPAPTLAQTSVGPFLGAAAIALADEADAVDRRDERLELNGGRRLTTGAGEHLYRFVGTTAPGTPSETPVTLTVGAGPPLAASIVTTDDFGVVVSTTHDLGADVPAAEARSRLSFVPRAMRRRLLDALDEPDGRDLRILEGLCGLTRFGPSQGTLDPDAATGPTEVDAAVSRVRELLGSSNAPASIAVLYCSSSKNRAYRLARALREAGIDAFWMTDPKDNDAKDRLALSRSPVVLSTVHSAKGLEFPSVVLCGLWRDGDDKDANRKLVYVGMTRAMENLSVVTTDDHPFAAAPGRRWAGWTTGSCRSPCRW